MPWQEDVPTVWSCPDLLGAEAVHLRSWPHSTHHPTPPLIFSGWDWKEYAFPGLELDWPG
jgi:hypothetical protein